MDGTAWFSRQGWRLAAILGVILAALFIKSFQPDEILFANDNTLGLMRAIPNRLPGAFTGKWHSGGWLGIEGLASAPSFSAIITMLLPAELFLKVYAPLTMLILGLCAWVLFRQLKLHPAVCLLGGLAAGLNMHFFSIACWGTGSWNIAAGMIFLALAALCTKSIPQLWARAVLAGLAVGMNLMEGFDVGAIMCIYVGVFIVWQIFVSDKRGMGTVAAALGTEVLVVLFAGLIAAHSISSLVGTQVVGVVGTSQDEQTKEQRWNPATQWSLPKLETLRIFMGGIYGYRMSGRINTPDKSSSYWGTVGRDTKIAAVLGDNPDARAKAIDLLNLPSQQRADLQSGDPIVQTKAIDALMHRPATVARYSGSGEYAGVLVSLLAIFGLVNSFRGAKSPFSGSERRFLWFWGAAAVFSLMASWGRHFFFYRLLYELPYVSTIRNPIKFMHPFHIAWLILMAYGLEALWRLYMRAPVQRTDILSAHLQNWWGKVRGFEKKWAVFSMSLFAIALVAFFIYDSRKPHLVRFLETDGFTANRAAVVADFSAIQAGWFVFWLLLSAGLVVGIMSGAWSGKQARLAWIYVGAIITLDLVKSDVPWIHYFNYKIEYTANSVVDFLQDKPYEHRVTGRISPKGLGSGIGTQLGQLYDYWQQNEFPYYKIQCLDFAQWPRVPMLDAAYLKNFALHGDDVFHCDLWPAKRLWELTNTKYILTSSLLLPLLNRDTDPQHTFTARSYLKVIQKPQVSAIEDVGDMTVVPDQGGSFALIDFTNALPRAKLYAAWETPTNGDDALKILLSHDFDPHHMVLVAPTTPVSQPSGDPKTDPGTVSISEYEPKHITLDADAATPAILMLNDKIAPAWKAYVDKKPVPLLRCNYLMRGVFLTPGAHTVDFRFEPSQTPFYVSLCAWGIGIATSGYLIYSRTPAPAPMPTPAPSNPAEPILAPQPAPANRPKPKRRR